MKIKRIGLDCDGLIADINPYWIDMYNKDYNDNLNVDDIYHWHTHYFVKKDCGKNFYNYLNKINFYRDIPIINGCQESIKRLYNKGYDLHIVTSVEENAIEDRIYWLNKYLPFIKKENIHIMNDKSNAPVDLLFDDCAENLETFHGVKVCMHYNYNIYLKSEHYRVNNWKVFEWLVDELNKGNTDIPKNRIVSLREIKYNF